MIDEPNITQTIVLKVFGIVLFLSLLQPDTTLGQFIDLRLEIDSKITAQTQQLLNFGRLGTNSGRNTIELGSVNMGIFSIKALENQMLLIALDTPSQLHHNNPAINETIPLELFSRYGYSTQNSANSLPLPKTANGISIEPNSESGPWNSIYIFIYGTVDIREIPDGTYSNQIVLNVEYI